MLTKSEIKRTAQKALIFSLIFAVTAFVVIGVNAVINNKQRSSHVLNPEISAAVLKESYIEDQLFVYGSAEADYNTTVLNNSNTDMYVFVEFDSQIIGGNTILTPEAAAGWELYDEGTTTVDGQSVYKYVYAYGNGGSMTALASSIETGNVFEKVMVTDKLTEEQYKTLGEHPFHVVIRAAVASASDGNADTVWSQVDKGY